jgi:hypothetical protein
LAARQPQSRRLQEKRSQGRQLTRQIDSPPTIETRSARTERPRSSFWAPTFRAARGQPDPPLQNARAARRSPSAPTQPRSPRSRRACPPATSDRQTVQGAVQGESPARVTSACFPTSDAGPPLAKVDVTASKDGSNPFTRFFSNTMTASLRECGSHRERSSSLKPTWLGLLGIQARGEARHQP